MSVNVKLVLAEALKVLKSAEEKELMTDRALEKMSKASTKDHDFPSIKKKYTDVYDTYIRGLELMNFCRRTGIEKDDSELSRFGAEKMKEYFERCEKLRKKETNILTSVNHADSHGAAILKEGYSFGEYLFVHQRKQGIKDKQPITYESTLEDGAYYLQVKNYDDYNVAAPTVKCQVQILNRGGALVKQQKIIPSRTCWGKYIGIVVTGTISVNVLTDAILRESHVEVTIRKLEPPADAAELKRQLSEGGKMDTDWVNSLPQLPGMPMPTSGVPGAPGQPGTMLPPPAQTVPPPPAAGPSPAGVPTADQLPPAWQMLSLPAPPEGADPNANYGFGLTMPQHEQPQYGTMPNPEPLGGNVPQQPMPAIGQPVDSSEMIGNLQVPGGSVHGSPTVPNDPDSTDTMAQLADLQVPYHKKTPTAPAAANPQFPQPGAPAAAAAAPAVSSSKDLEPVVNPKGMSAKERLARVQHIVNSYPTDGPSAEAEAESGVTKLSGDHRQMLEDIRGLPEPTPLGEEDEMGDLGLGEMDLELGDLDMQ